MGSGDFIHDGTKAGRSMNMEWTSQITAIGISASPTSDIPSPYRKVASIDGSIYSATMCDDTICDANNKPFLSSYF